MIVKKRQPVSRKKAEVIGGEATAKLFVSFWHISLDNLPEGSFTRRRMTPRAAKRLIKEARTGNCLVGVSNDELFAPYRKAERENHEALCRVLTEDFDIAIALKDFASTWDDDDPGCCINPLVFARVKGGSRLLVVTCCYVLEKITRKSGRPIFTIDPTTVEFHLLEFAPKR